MNDDPSYEFVKLLENRGFGFGFRIDFKLDDLWD